MNNTLAKEMKEISKKIDGNYIFTVTQKDTEPLSSDYGYYLYSLEKNHIPIVNLHEINEVVDHMLIQEEARQKYNKTSQEVMMGLLQCLI